MAEEIMEYMSQDNTPAPNPMPGAGVMARMDNINQGTVAIEASRAIAEAQAALVIAKRCPRNEVEAYAKAMQACQRPSMAAKAFYSFPRGGQTVAGPTIRFAEELARCWGNLDYGIKELSQDDGKSEMQAYAWDQETNVRSVQNFTNPHQREKTDRKTKTVVMEDLTSQRDIYENNANMATRRLRARILAILPSWFVEDAIEECKRTLAGQNDIPLIDRVKRMVVQFAKMGVTQEQIEKRLKKKIETMNADDFTEFIGIYNAIKQGESKIADWFETEKIASELTNELNEDGLL